MRKIALTLFMALLDGAVALCAAQLADSVSTSHNLQEVVVTGIRGQSDIKRLPATVTVVDRATIEQSRETSVLQVLNTEVPGFFATSRGVMGYGVSTGGSGQMSVRGIGGAAQSGLPTTSLMVLIDGHPQYMGLMGHPIADAYSTMVAERVEVQRGPASALYGSGAMGGVVNIITRKMAANSSAANVSLAAGSYGTIEAEATGWGNFGLASSMLALSYNRSDGHRSNMGFDQYNAYLKLGYSLSNHWKAAADANVTLFTANNPGAVDDPYYDNYQRIGRGTASVAVSNDYGMTSGTLSVFYNWGEHKINDGYQEGEEPLDYRYKSSDYTLGVSLYQNFSLFKGNRTTAGADYQHFGGKAWNQYITDGSRSYLADKKMDEIAAYIDFGQALTTWLTADVAARVDHHSRCGTQLIPQVGLVANMPNNGTLKAMASRGYRNPTIREMYMFAPQNPDLEPESLWSYELSYSQMSPDGRLSCGASIFYINGDNIIMRLANPNGSGMLNQNSGEIENWGTEVSVGYIPAHELSFTCSYSWLHMENPVLASPEHKLSFVARWQQGRWNASATVQHIAGLYTDLDEPSTERFTLLDLQCGFMACKLLSLYVKGENLLAQRYEIMSGYPMPRATFMAGIKLSF